MSQLAGAHAHSDTKHTSGHDDFLVRFRKNLVKELILSIKIMRMAFGVIFAVVFGFFFFIKEFDFAKKFFALAFLPAATYIMGTYLTLLPMTIIIAVTIVSLFSLANAKEGDDVFNWFGDIIGSVVEASTAGSKDEISLSKKIFGFVVLSSVASFFIVFLI
jgi:hypothetical protein